MVSNGRFVLDPRPIAGAWPFLLWPQNALASNTVGILLASLDALLGSGSDFYPVMLYEARSITPRQRAQLADMRSEYEGVWDPVLRRLHDSGRLHADVKLARLLVFGALNWSVQWFDRRREASLDDLTSAALALFIGETP